MVLTLVAVVVTLVSRGNDARAEFDSGSEDAEELVLARAPEVILEVRSADIGSAEEAATEARSWAPLASVPAVRDQRVVVLTGQGLTVPGPRVVDVVERMYRALHPAP